MVEIKGIDTTFNILVALTSNHLNEKGSNFEIILKPLISAKNLKKSVHLLQSSEIGSDILHLNGKIQKNGGPIGLNYKAIWRLAHFAYVSDFGIQFCMHLRALINFYPDKIPDGTVRTQFNSCEWISILGKDHVRKNSPTEKLFRAIISKQAIKTD